MAFESSDGVLFKIHRKNLDTHSEGFSSPEGISISPDAVVVLSETAEVLELLFQYMYPQRQPKISMVDFEILSDLAEAAEKYQVYSALDILGVHMKCARSWPNSSA